MRERFMRYRQLIPVLLIAVVVAGGTYFFLPRSEPPPLTIITPSSKPTATAVTIKVDVRGAVAKPGVYALPAGSRVEDVLTAAGNLLANADVSKLNLARLLKDGEQILVPSKNDTPTVAAAPTLGGSPSSTTSPKTSSAKININTASVAELDTLSGIGPALAQNIVDYRSQNGLFKQIEDLKKVRGIGDALFERIKDRITID